MLVSEERGLHLSWDLIRDTDIRRVNIYRYQNKRDDYQIIGSIEITDDANKHDRFLDRNVTDQASYSYFLDAADVSGNISEFSEPVTGKYIKPATKF